MRSSDPRTVTFKPSSAPEERVEVEGAPTTSQGDGELGRYALDQVIGQGGMGTVLLVRDPWIGRRVALKQLNEASRGDAVARARFEREARLQGQLEHPAIVPVYDVGSMSDGSPFFTMRRVRGQSLSEVLRQIRKGEATRFSRRKLLSAMSQLCLAAHYAHERGVVHRDIKPTNIMLGPYGEVYLLDWGVAKIDSEDEPRTSDPTIDPSPGVHTASGTVMGTLSTMAPEQALGARVDARTDVYALGAVLFEVLTLEPLHPKGTVEEVVPRIVAGVEARPSVRVPDADVPPELEEICVAATRVDPADRLESALRLHEAIEAYLDGDRDLELRRESSLEHAAAAQAGADEALGADGDDSEREAARARALREVGRALALDPSNRDALATLVRLLTTPPKLVPREVEDEQHAVVRRQQRMGGIAAAVVYGYVSLNFVSTWLLGVRDVSVFGIAHGLWALAFVAGLVTIARPSYATLFVTFLLGVGTSLYVTNVYGPYLVVPMLLTSHAVLFAFVRPWKLRIAIIAIAAAAWTTSVFGEMYGLFPDTVRFAAGDLSMHSPVIDLPEVPTTLYLYAVVLASLVAPALVVGFMRSAWHRNDQAMRLLAWQLRRLVSAEATEVIREPTK